MAEGIVAGLAQTVITQLGFVALQDIGSALGVNKEVRRLQNTLTAIKDVLPHAENLQLSNNDVKSWLRRIKDAAYDAEDVIDDFATNALRKKLMTRGSSIERVRHFASSSNPILLSLKMAHRIKEVRKNLRDILDDQSFGLEKRVQENHGFISEGRQTHSFIPEGKVVGRDMEREEIVKLLLDWSGGDSLSVIPIQGMGGIGKTAPAQLVYNDKRVVDSFVQNRMWVCVSDEFDVQTITEKIIKSGTDKECPNLDMDQLQSRLRQHLGGKRYLLVLDDIWNEEMDKWGELRDLLIGGASGSKIIVTTRSERVGSIMGTGVVLPLSKLSEVDCWNLFKGRAFKEGEEEADSELVEIGRDIAKKCFGVPLAVKTLGGLCFQAKKQMWEFVRDNGVWRLPEEKNGILRALRISYNHLSFYLKQCFAYCSIFPKDFYIQKDMLIKIWIAQGFIHSFGDNRSLEDIGEEYVEVLMWRSFFQEPELDCYNLITFKMHDLVHDLAQSVVGVECFNVCRDKEENYPQGVRHLFFNDNVSLSPSTFETPNIIPKPSNIRSLVFASNIDFSVSTIFSSLKFLRVLQFTADHIDHLPNSIDKLKHLRYFHIESEQIKKLPESITNLQNLQVLNLRCHKLEKLPDRIQNMISLRHIDLGNFCSPCSHMPPGLEELKSLQTLSHFYVSKDKVGCKLNGLNALTNLGGTLDIRNLENVKNAKESVETNLKTKRNLQMLSLYWDEEFARDISREAISFEVLENLEPHSNLKRLEINCYVGTRFPRWMRELRNVVEVRLWKCEKCEQLFPISHLPSLKVLRVKVMDAVKCIEGTPEQSQKAWFPSLTTLDFWYCPNLESWFPMQSQQQQEVLSLSISFPSLVELYIKDCPKLKNMPLLLPSIIKTLELSNTSCELVHSVLREGNSSLTSLEQLSIRNCESLESWPNCLESQLKNPTPYLSLPSLLSLDISYSLSLPFLPQQIQHLTALQYLSISNYCEEALPEWMANITSLQRLIIQKCPNLQILPEWMGNLTSLQSLSIYSCPTLQILPDWVLRVNSTIQYLKIYGCPQLTHRYNKDTGEDRHKLAHIRDTHIYTRIGRHGSQILQTVTGSNNYS